jgi:excisionase family DNA binding protein
MFHDYGDILTVDDVCEMLLIGRNSVYSLLNLGQIKSVRVGRKHRIPRESVINYIIQRSR